MRLLMAGVAAILCFQPFVSAEDKQPAEKKETVAFDGIELTLAFETRNDKESLKEYLPEGEKLDAWTKLASIREYHNVNDPKAVVDNMIRKLNEQYPGSPSSVLQNRQTGELVVDFVVRPADKSFIEFNVFRFVAKSGGGVIAHQFALRDAKDPQAFYDNLKPLRDRLVPQMARTGLQTGK
jgi:hypothetical protein